MRSAWSRSRYCSRNSALFTLPCRAGLSQMSKEFEEELFFPSGKLHLAGDGAIIGMRAQDVERNAAQDGKILWAVVLAGPRVVLVEDDIEPPVQLIFYAPVRTRDLEQTAGRKAFGQHDVVDGLGELAIGLALGLDAANGGEAGEGRRLRGPRNDAGAATLTAVMIAVALLIEGELALGVGRREGRLRTGKQRAMIGLELDGVMRALLAHFCGHAGVTMQGISGDGAALQDHAFEGRQRGRDLVAAGRVSGRKREPGLGIPHAHHERSHAGAAAFIAAPQSLAVDRDHAIGRLKPHPLAQRLGEADECLGHVLRIEETEQAAEAVVAWRAMLKIDDLGKLSLVGGSKIGDIDARLRSTQGCRQPNEQHRRDIVPRIEVARVANLTENRNKRFHPGSPKSGKPLKNPLLLLMQQRSTHLRFPYPQAGEGRGEGASPRVFAGVDARGESAPLTPTLSPQERGEGDCYAVPRSAHVRRLPEKSPFPVRRARQ